MINTKMSEEELRQRIHTEIAVVFAGNDLTNDQHQRLMDDRAEPVDVIMRYINQYTLSKQLEIRSEEVKNLYELRKLYDRYELEDARDPSGVKMASWQGYKSFRNPISDRIEAITGVRHDQGIEEWLNSNKSKER